MYLDFFDILLGLLNKLENKKIIIFGADKSGKKAYVDLKNLEKSTAYFVDNDPAKQNTCFLNTNIYSPNKLLEEHKEDIIILIASYYIEAIKEQLIQMGFEDNKHFYALVSKNKNHFKVGRYTYGHNFLKPEVCPFIQEIGSFCSIAPDVKIGVDNHLTDIISSHSFLRNPAFGNFINECDEKLICHEKNKKVIIGNDVWIGTNAIILPNVTVGNGAVIGAGAIVTKDVPDYAIVVGVPAKVLKYRFNPEEIEILNQIKWWDWPDEKIKENVHLFYDKDTFFEYAKSTLNLSKITSTVNNSLPKTNTEVISCNIKNF